MTTPQYPQSPGGQPQWSPPPGQSGPGWSGQQPTPPPGGQQPWSGQQPPPPPGQQPPWSGHQPPPPPGGPAGPGAYQGGYPGVPGAPAAKSSKTKNIVSAIVLVVILGGLSVFADLQNKDSVVNAETGDCVRVDSRTDFQVVDCAAAEAQYKVVDVVEDFSLASICSNNSDVDYAIEISGDTNKSLCLQTWLQVGDCAATDGTWSECGSAESAYEVTDVLENTQDDTQCPDTTVVVRVYSGENNVICLAERLGPT